MKRTATRTALVLAALAALLLGLPLLAGAGDDDPFAAGTDALAVNEDDGSGSLRAKIKLTKMSDDMVIVKVRAVDRSAFPRCIFTAQVVKAARSKARHFKLMARGKVYRFAPVLKMTGKGKRRRLDLSDARTRENLGGCYYAKRTKLIVRVSGVDLKARAFTAAEIHVK